MRRVRADGCLPGMVPWTKRFGAPSLHLRTPVVRALGGPRPPAVGCLCDEAGAARPRIRLDAKMCKSEYVSKCGADHPEMCLFRYAWD